MSYSLRKEPIGCISTPPPPPPPQPPEPNPIFWPTVLSREQKGYQKHDPGGDHYYVGCLGIHNHWYSLSTANILIVNPFTDACPNRDCDGAKGNYRLQCMEGWRRLGSPIRTHVSTSFCGKAPLKCRKQASTVSKHSAWFSPAKSDWRTLLFHRHCKTKTKHTSTHYSCVYIHAGMH